MTPTNTQIIPVILCGGMGSRLWPLSRKNYPKQFLSLGEGDKSLLQDTVIRVRGQGFLPPVIVTNEEHRFLVAEHMRAIGCACDIVLEPEGRNTAPAVAAAALFIQEKYGNAHMLVLPSDHLIKDEPAFIAAVNKAAEAADAGHVVTFGITPEYPETGYGYIQKGAALLGEGILKVAAFVEKPNRETAEAYIASGEYAWNSGMFMFPSALFLSELAEFEPQIVSNVEKALVNGYADADFTRLAKEDFLRAPSISVDYALMERTKKAATVPVSCFWSDAGAWDALWRTGDKDVDGNVVSGSVITKSTKDCYLRSENGPTIAALGLENLVVVSTPDMVLVADQSHSQTVKQLMEDAGERNDKWVDNHTRVYRPWGFYETIQLGERHQVKHIQVSAGAKLSVQMHHHRAEHWIIVSGTAKVLCGEEEVVLSDNQYIHIPLGAVHCIENIGKIPLSFIEVQHGGYLGEDDIVRFEDRYGRAGAAGVAVSPKPKLIEKEAKRATL
jgi:mannose-1-phosphate guanylyltransferase / mannose-6-phosphate isomerase